MFFFSDVQALNGLPLLTIADANLYMLRTVVLGAAVLDSSWESAISLASYIEASGFHTVVPEHLSKLPLSRRRHNSNDPDLQSMM